MPDAFDPFDIEPCDDEQERQHLALLRAYNIEGLIVNTLGHHRDELFELRSEMPMVLVDRKVDRLDTDLVGLDNPAAVEMALDHLDRRGYRDLLLVTEPFDGTSSRIERVDSFRTGIERRPALAGTVLETGDQLLPRIKTFLAQPDRGPKALFCANGIAALAALAAGVVNAVAGGGTLITFPTLVAIGSESSA